MSNEVHVASLIRKLAALRNIADGHPWSLPSVLVSEAGGLGI
jgi:hypothetical protein